jgi:hypothetical protein
VINVNDLTGTDVNRVDLNLDAGQGSGVGDLVADSVTLNGTPGNDTIDVQGSAHNVEIAGLAATVSVRAADAADSLKIETGAGNDIVDAGDLDPGTIQLFVDGVHQ